MTDEDTMDQKPTAVIVGILCFILTGVLVGNGDYVYGVMFAIGAIIGIIVLLKTDSGETSWKDSLKESTKAGLEAGKWWLIGAIIAIFFFTYL